MAEIISTIDIDKNKDFEEISENIKQKNDNLEQTDPSVTCMTRTIVPNKRPIEKKDIDRFVKRVKKRIPETNKTKVKKEDKKSTGKKVEKSNEETKKRGRPKMKKSTVESPDEVHSTVE